MKTGPVEIFLWLLAWLAIFLAGALMIVIIILWDGKIHKRGATGETWYVVQHNPYDK